MGADILIRPGGGFGHLLRVWRQRRRLSQMELSLAAGVSTRHLSFIETGRSRPSAEMVLNLADELEIPLRERNQLLLAAGFAPAFSQTDFDSPELDEMRETIAALLRAHEPWPAIVIDRHWGLVAANATVEVLLAGVDEHLLEHPANVLRLTLHPDGMAPRIRNLGQWADFLLGRLRRDAIVTGDPALEALHAELAGLPAASAPRSALPARAGVAVPLELENDHGLLRMLSTHTSFGGATDVTFAELAIEAFLPADAATRAALTEVAVRQTTTTSTAEKVVKSAS